MFLKTVEKTVERYEKNRWLIQNYELELFSKG